MRQPFPVTLLLAALRGDPDGANIDLRSGAYVLGIALGKQTEEHMVDRNLGKEDERLNLPNKTIRTLHTMVPNVSRPSSRVLAALRRLDREAKHCTDPQSDDLLSAIFENTAKTAHQGGQRDQFLKAADTFRISLHHTEGGYISTAEAPTLSTIITTDFPIKDPFVVESCKVLLEADARVNDPHQLLPSSVFLTTLCSSLIHLIIENDAADLLFEVTDHP